jgi:hypothetical protein
MQVFTSQPAKQELLLFSLTAANMNSTADQALTKLLGFTNFLITRIRAANSSGNLTTAAGGIYTGAAKAGNAIVAAAGLYAIERRSQRRRPNAGGRWLGRPDDYADPVAHHRPGQRHDRRLLRFWSSPDMRLILAFLFLLGTGFASATPLDDTINTMDTQLKDAIGKATTARTYVSSVKTSVLALEAQLATALSDLAAAQAASTGLQASLAVAQAQTAQVQADFDAYKSMILQKFGPLGLVDWQKAEYRGYALDLSGFSEVFRSDFNDLSQISGPTGAGPWYSSVHSGFGGAGFVPIGGANDPYSIVNGALQIRVSHVGTVTNAGWYGGIIQTMRADGTGFALGLDAKAGVSDAHQAIAFEAKVRLPPADPAYAPCCGGPLMYTAGSPAHGHWGSFWLLSAADFHSEITDFLIEQDVFETYGDDKGDHSTVHIKSRKVPQPGDYQYPNGGWRVSKSLFSDPQTVVNTTGGAKTFPASTTLGDGQFHTYTQVMDDQWITEYLDGFSIGRFPMRPEFRTPLYMLINHTTYADKVSSIPATLDMQVDYARALAKN